MIERCKNCEWNEYRPVKRCENCTECENPCPEKCSFCGHEPARYENWIREHGYLCDGCRKRLD